MIIIQSLSLRNFMNIESVDLTFSENSLNIFYGDNGSGKSSIFEAISVCLTERKRGESFKEMVRIGFEEASIELSILYEGVPMHFKTTLYNKKNMPPSKRIIKYQDSEYVNSECSKFLASLQWDHLQHAMFSHQGEYNITDLKAYERTKLLKVIFNLELEEHVEKLDSMIDVANQSIITYQAQRDALQFDVQSEAALYAVLTDEQIATYNAQIAAAQASINDIRSKLDATKEQAIVREQLVRQLQVHQSQMAQVQTRLTSISNKIQETRDKVTQVAAQTAAYEADIKSLTASIANETNDLESIKKNIDTTVIALDHCKADLVRYGIQKDQLDIKIDQHKKGLCDRCGQKTDPDKVHELLDELDELLRMTKAREVERNVVENQLAELEKTKAGLQTSITTCKSRLDASSNAINANANMVTMYNQAIVEDSSHVDQLNLDLDSSKTEIAQIEASLEHSVEIDTSSFTAELAEHEAAIRAIQDVLVKNQSAIAINKDLEESNRKIRERAEQNEERKNELRQAISTETSSIDTYKDVRKILATELPSFAIVKACNKLEKEINRFIKRIRPNMIVRLAQYRGGVSFTYRADETLTNSEEYMSVRMASGAEKELLSLAWRYALAKAYNLHILMLDEIDSAASIDSSEAIFSTLATSNEFNQLFVITHKPEAVSTIKNATGNAYSWQVSHGTFTQD